MGVDVQDEGWHVGLAYMRLSRLNTTQQDTHSPPFSAPLSLSLSFFLISISLDLFYFYYYYFF